LGDVFKDLDKYLVCGIVAQVVTKRMLVIVGMISTVLPLGIKGREMVEKRWCSTCPR
jgi:hypothetical protein